MGLVFVALSFLVYSITISPDSLTYVDFIAVSVFNLYAFMIECIRDVFSLYLRIFIERNPHYRFLIIVFRSFREILYFFSLPMTLANRKINTSRRMPASPFNIVVGLIGFIWS